MIGRFFGFPRTFPFATWTIATCRGHWSGWPSNNWLRLPSASRYSPISFWWSWGFGTKVSKTPWTRIECRKIERISSHCPCKARNWTDDVPRLIMHPLLSEVKWVFCLWSRQTKTYLGCVEVQTSPLWMYEKVQLCAI